ncbi:MAG: hypothetical protein J07HQX50_01952 [Haloquadratum sp. J07HQX50]|nr:MAG: hypothetical protein J07HQX50_01952 [Haloquadratum sp. J07HQX50]
MSLVYDSSTRREQVGRVLAAAQPDTPASHPITGKNTDVAGSSGVITPGVGSSATENTSGAERGAGIFSDTDELNHGFIFSYTKGF